VKWGQYVNSKKLDYKYPIFPSKTGNNKEKMGGEYFQVSFTKKLRGNPTNWRGGSSEFLAKGWGKQHQGNKLEGISEAI